MSNVVSGISIAKPPRWLWRPVKLFAAFALVAAAGAALLPSRTYVISDNAVVTAYTVALRSPVGGDVSGLDTQVGDTVAAHAVLSSVEDRRFDESSLVALREQAARLLREREGIEAERRTLQTMADRLGAEAKTFQELQAEYMQDQADEASRRLLGAQARLQQQQRDTARKLELAQHGDAPRAEIEHATAETRAAERDLTAQAARAQALELAARAAANGVSLGDGANNVPYSRQRADEIDMRLADLDRMAATLDGSLEEARKRLSSETRQASLRREATLESPSDGMIWLVGASNGERVAPGATIAEVVDCRSTFLLALIPQKRFMDVAVGDVARFMLSGDTAERTGRVLSVTGDTVADVERHMAAMPVPPRNTTATVRIEGPASLNSGGECLIGRTARVLLPTTAEGGSLLRAIRRAF